MVPFSRIFQGLVSLSLQREASCRNPRKNIATLLLFGRISQGLVNLSVHLAESLRKLCNAIL